jgi:site-specific DNA-methyltransferase (cytosine-N4-specific)
MATSERPKADNRRVLKAYSDAMLRLLATKKYNAGKRPSEHNIGAKSFLRDNKGAIPPNVLTYSNTSSSNGYLKYCREHNFTPHPARMAEDLPKFFINLLTNPRNLVLDPFAGSNVTGAIADQLKRRWISIEAREDYIESSRGRFGSSLL